MCRIDDKMSSFSQIPLEAITLYRKALEMSGRGKHKEALKYLSNAVMIAPQFSSAHCEMGRCYENLGRFPDAVVKFDKVLKIHPSHAEAEMNRNRILDKIRNNK